MSHNTDDNNVDINTFSRIEKYVAVMLKVFQNIGMALVIVLMFITVAHAVGRYFFHFPIPGIVEISGFLVLTIVFFSGAYSAFIDGQISIDSITKHFSENAKVILSGILDVICLVISIFAMWQSIERGFFVSETGQYTDVLRIPIYPFLFLVAFGWGLFVLSILTRLFKLYLKLVKK